MISLSCTATRGPDGPTATVDASPRKALFNIREYGAVGDGRTLDTPAINRAIVACHEAGGGTVHIPAGRFVAGAIRLRSHVTLDLAAGATLLGSQDFDDYPLIEGLWGGDPGQHYSSLINADGATSIAVTGRGTIDGRGNVWWDAHLQGKLKHPPGRLIGLYRCKGVRIEGVSLRNSPAWTVHPAYCENVTIAGVTIINPYRGAPTTDGIDVDSSRNVCISGCYVAVGDDCIVIKAGKGDYGRRVGMPSENITISNCITGHGHGGVVFGSETAGGIRNVVVTNCVFDGTDSGIRMKTCRGRGGVVENVRISNIVMRNIGQVAIKLDMKYEETAPEPVSERTPAFRHIHLANITVDNALQAAYLDGLPEMPIEEFSLHNADFRTQSGLHVAEAKGVEIGDLDAVVQKGPVLHGARISDLTVAGVRCRTPRADSPLIELQDVRGAWLRDCFPAAGTGTFMKLTGRSTRDIVLSGNLLHHAKEGVFRSEEVPEAAATFK